MTMTQSVDNAVNMFEKYLVMSQSFYFVKAMLQFIEWRGRRGVHSM